MESIDKLEGTFAKTRSEEAGPTAVSRAVVGRLPRYHRYLRMLIESGCGRISSSALSALMGLSASQVRQDFNCFGGFGQQGYGYNVKYLYGEIGDLLGVNEGYRAVILGAGNLGRALAGTHMFERRGVTRLCLFDCDAALVGRSIYGLPVYDVATLEDFCRAERVDLAVMATPPEAAPALAERLAAAGVKGILNFANTELTDVGGCLVENVHLSDPLMKLCYDMKHREEGGK